MVPQHTQESSVTPLSPSSAGSIIEIATTSTSNTTNSNSNSNSTSATLDLNNFHMNNDNNLINMNNSTSNLFGQSSIEMDTTGNKYIVNSILFGSQRVDIHSTTPYSDATQRLAEHGSNDNEFHGQQCHTDFYRLYAQFMTAPTDRPREIRNLPPSGRRFHPDLFYTFYGLFGLQREIIAVFICLIPKK